MRFVDDDIEQHHQEAVEEKVAQKSEEANDLHARMGVFGAKGWKQLYQELLGEANTTIAEMLARHTDAEAYYYLKGKVHGLQRVLELEESTKERIKNLNREIKELGDLLKRNRESDSE